MMLQNRPIVAITESVFWQYYYAIADGLDIEQESAEIWECYQSWLSVSLDIISTWNLMVYAHRNKQTSTISTFDAYLEFTLAVGNISTAFQSCWNDLDNSLYTFTVFVMHYEDGITYLINLLPNILSYAFFIQDWIDRIKELQED